VETLADIIQTGNTPLTIGVFGTWGSGLWQENTSFLYIPLNWHSCINIDSIMPSCK